MSHLLARTSTTCESDWRCVESVKIVVRPRLPCDSGRREDGGRTATIGPRVRPPLRQDVGAKKVRCVRSRLTDIINIGVAGATAQTWYKLTIDHARHHRRWRAGRTNQNRGVAAPSTPVKNVRKKAGRISVFIFFLCTRTRYSVLVDCSAAASVRPRSASSAPVAECGGSGGGVARR